MNYSTSQSKRRLLFYTLFLAYICAGIVSILPGPTLPILAQHTGVALAVAGWAFTSGATGFMVGVAIAGMMIGRIGPKYVLMSGLAIMTCAGIVIPWTHLFLLLLAAQFVAGIGFGFLDVSINIIVTLSFEDTLGETLNNLHSSYGIGALLAPLVLSLALQVAHEAIWAYLTGSLMGLAGIFLLVRQHLPSVPRRNEALQQQDIAVSSTVFRQVLLWLMALQMGLYVGAEVGFSSWIVTAVSQSALISLALAAPSATALSLYSWRGHQRPGCGSLCEVHRSQLRCEPAGWIVLRPDLSGCDGYSVALVCTYPGDGFKRDADQCRRGGYDFAGADGLPHRGYRLFLGDGYTSPGVPDHSCAVQPGAEETTACTAITW